MHRLNRSENRKVRRSVASLERRRRKVKSALGTTIIPGSQFPHPPIATSQNEQAAINQQNISVIGCDLPGGGSLSYTVGMGTHLGKPELVIIGMDRELAGHILTELVEVLRNLDYLGHDILLERQASPKLNIGVRGTADCAKSIQSLHSFYQGQTVHLVQCFWSDENGDFPWDVDPVGWHASAQFPLPSDPL